MTEPTCDHPHWMRIGNACGPCFSTYWRARLPVGTLVTYDDEALADLPPDLRGVIAEPTGEELEHVKTYPDTVGPDAGDVLVQWGDEQWDRSWVDPRDLQVLPAVR